MTARALLYCAGGGIGDSLVASVVGRALRRHFTTVDALTLAGHRAALERVPDLDAVLVDDESDERAFAETVRERGYDACVVTWATPRTARIPWRAGIPIRVGQARRLYSFRFTDRVVVRSEIGDVTSHWSDILLDYARAIDCDTDDRAYRFVPTLEDDREARDLLEARGWNAGNFVILNPCNAVASKRGIWPAGGWARTARALAEHYAMPVLVSGSPADAPIAERIAAEAGDPAASIAGTLGIGAFGALARQARAFVGITTGSMHVAAAVGCPTAGIFPFQSDYPDRWAPLGRHVAIVRPSYPCHPGDTKERCRDYACIERLDVERILAAARTL
ncbi:MAG: glycosyltransferase family 9 protein [Candidatus Eremiobacteraeota bacterium]|nr:glycosyltransferase family 9 protein [Candidatus Eremiobacteraeota bacterium]